MINSAIDKIQDTTKDLQEIIKERFLSPMYFYFIIAWVITNWKFTYTLLFADEELIGKPKIEYLSELYKISHWTDWLYNFSELILVPILFSYISVWWLSRASEKFYEKYEQHKINNVVIKRKLDYTARYQEAQEQRKIRDLESDKQNIQYTDNEEFNEYVDNLDDQVTVLGYSLQPSWVLYSSDYEIYKEALQEWKQSKLEEDFKEKVRDEVIEEYKDGIR